MMSLKAGMKGITHEICPTVTRKKADAMSEKVGRFSAATMPIKLEIASRILAGINSDNRNIIDICDDPHIVIRSSLGQADALIQAYNDQLEGE